LRVNLVGVALLLIVVAVGFGSASLVFQFERIPSEGADGLGWDPWTQKACVVLPEQQLVCGPAGIVVYQRSASL
jgi:hypothetical protein